MKTWKVRERCLEALAWTPIGICLLMVGWGYWVFTFSVCRYLLTHDHVFQGVVYLVMVSTIAVLLIWSYSIASFTSPGYPSEILQRYSGYHSASQGDISMVDREDGVHVGLLESEQPYLSPSPNGGDSGAAGVATHAVTGTVNRSSLLVSEGAFSGERGTENSAQLHSSLSLNMPPPLPPLQAVDPRQQHPDHTIVRMTDERLNTVGHGHVHGHSHGGIGDEGDNDDAEDNMPLGRSIRRFTVKRDGKMRYCQKCKFEKPDRTHHCSSCKRCVLKMDHHCPWLNNCVGHKNYKAFFLFVLWTAVYCVALVACTIPVAAEVAYLPYGENEFDPQWVFIIFVALIFGLCLVPFAIQHLLLIKSNKTTIESFEKHKYRMGNNGEVMQSRVLNVFDLGRKQNFIQVLGPVWYLWLIPVRNSMGDGWSYPANEYGKSMLHRDDDDHSVHSRYTSNYNQWTPSGSSSPQSHHRQLSRSNNNNNSNNLLLTHTQYQQQVNSGYESFDLNENDTDDADQEHVRRDSDESDDDGQQGGGEGRRRRQQPTPRRFRQQRGGLPATRNDSDDEEAEEYLYDSDEPATFHFTDTGR